MRIIVLMIASLSLLLSSCVTTPNLLPSSHDETASAHHSYNCVKTSYDQIVLNQTTKEDLKKLGFNIYDGKNIEVLTYVDVSKLFMHNSAISKEELPEGVLECLQAKGGCQAYKFSAQNIEKKRFGNYLADALNFRKKVHYTGWKFEALFIMVDGKVVYTLHSGQPNIDRTEIEKNPLGPLQGFGGDDLTSILF
jgi:hypothetical protein